jgi:alkylhydroperoxidase/carboxymuconolactone decarboxylase family protein YurZ
MGKAYERGMKTRRKVLADEWVDLAEKNKTPFNANSRSFITRYVWDEIWNRPGLGHEVRRTIVIVITLCLGRWEDTACTCARASSRGTSTRAGLKEILLQAAVYAGVPAANTAFKEAREVIDALGKRRRREREGDGG